MGGCEKQPTEHKQPTKTTARVITTGDNESGGYFAMAALAAATALLTRRSLNPAAIATA